MVMFILIVLNIVTACLSSRMAERRGRSARAWTWLGIVFGSFAWLIVARSPSHRNEGMA